MATHAALADRIRTELGKYLRRDLASISLEHTLRDDLGLDSMATIELLYRIEEAFDLQIPDEDLPELVTVGNVVSYVERRLAPARPTHRAASPAPPRKKKRG